MKLKEKIKSYSFWVSLASAVILILKVLGSRFGFKIDESMISDLFTAICSILVILGIIVVPQPKDSETNSPKNSIITKQPSTDQLIDNTIHSTNSDDEHIESLNTQNNIDTDDSSLVKKIQNIETYDSNILELDALKPDTNNIQQDATITSDIHNEENLTQVLIQEREKYSGNIDEFINILNNEINSLKTKEEA